MQTSRTQSGFAVIETVLVLVAVAVAGFVGYYVYSANNKTTDTYNAGQSSATPTTTRAKKATDTTPATTTTKSAASNSSLKTAADSANPTDSQSTNDMSAASSSLNDY